MSSRSTQGDGGSGDWTSTGWQPWFSDIGFMPGDKQALDGTGSSLHITAFPGAALSLQFYGDISMVCTDEHFFG